MARYRRAKVEGGVFFFTVALADRSSDLLVRRIDRLRRVYMSVQERYPFEMIAICVLPDTSTPSGRCRQATRIFLCAGILSRAGLHAGSLPICDAALAR